MPMLTPVAVITSRALIQASKTSAASRARKPPAKRVGRLRPSCIWSLGVRLFKSAASIEASKPVGASVTFVRTRYAAWRLRRATKVVVDALDDLIIPNTRPWPNNLEVLLGEIESRKRHWHVAGPQRPILSN